MAKKTRQRGSVSSVNPRSYSEYLKREESSLAEPTPETREKARVVKKSEPVVEHTETWGGEYKQVLADLRQLLVISVVLFVAMIVLGLVI